MWEVKYSKLAAKNIKAKKEGLSQAAKSAMEALHLDLEANGPNQHDWPNYSKLKSQGRGVDRRHCHLQRGRPTYVACWEVIDKEKKI